MTEGKVSLSLFRRTEKSLYFSQEGKGSCLSVLERKGRSLLSGKERVRFFLRWEDVSLLKKRKARASPLSTREGNVSLSFQEGNVRLLLLRREENLSYFQM